MSHRRQVSLSKTEAKLRERTPSPPPTADDLFSKAERHSAQMVENKAASQEQAALEQHGNPYKGFYYKLVAIQGSTLYSIFDGRTRYAIGEVKRQVRGQGGFYVYPTQEQARAAVFPKHSVMYIAPRVVIKCAAWGNCRRGRSNEALIFSNICPLEVIHLPTGYHCHDLKMNCRTSKAVRLDVMRSQSTPFQRSNANLSQFSNAPSKQREQELRQRIQKLNNTNYHLRSKPKTTKKNQLRSSKPSKSALARTYRLT